MVKAQMKNEEPPSIGFIVLHEISSASFVGAILITDQNGFPLEYRFTEKIQIDEIKRMLYGDSLKSFLMAEIVGINLLNKLEKKPVFIIAKEEYPQLQKKTNYPILCLENKKKITYQQLIELTREKGLSLDLYKVPKQYFEAEVTIDEPFKRIIQLLEKSS